MHLSLFVNNDSLISMSALILNIVYPLSRSTAIYFLSNKRIKTTTIIGLMRICHPYGTIEQYIPEIIIYHIIYDKKQCINPSRYI